MMLTIDELIEFYPEGDFVDFKSQEYGKEKKADLIKDVMSLANSHYKCDKFIVIGVKKSIHKISLYNIDQPTDSASIQQLIHDNISKDLNIEYYSYLFKNKNLVILRIINPIDRPYQAKKHCQKGDKIVVREGDIWIRKGSYQRIVSTDDLDKIYLNKYKDHSLDGKISLVFSGNGQTTIDIVKHPTLKLPSETYQNELSRIIQIRARQLINNPAKYENAVASEIPTNPTTWKMEKLRWELEHCKSYYAEEDAAYINEVMAHKFNLTILNSGDKYIYNAIIEITIPKLTEIIVRNGVFRKVPPIAVVIEHPIYPTVTERDDTYIISSELGNVRHQISQEVFEDDLRIVINKKFNAGQIPLSCKILGENIPEAIKFNLVINVNESHRSK